MTEKRILHVYPTSNLARHELQVLLRDTPFEKKAIANLQQRTVQIGEDIHYFVAEADIENYCGYRFQEVFTDELVGGIARTKVKYLCRST